MNYLFDDRLSCEDKDIMTAISFIDKLDFDLNIMISIIKSKSYKKLIECGFVKEGSIEKLIKNCLDKQIMKVTSIMSASDTKEEFETLYEKTKR